MKKETSQNPMEEELDKLRRSNVHRTRVGMSELLIRQIKDSNVESKFVSLEIKPKDFRFPLEKQNSSDSLGSQSVASEVTNDEEELGLSKEMFKELTKVIRKWGQKSKFCSKAGDSIGSSVYNDCSNTLYEIVHRTRKASVRNGLKKKK